MAAPIRVIASHFIKPRTTEASLKPNAEKPHANKADEDLTVTVQVLLCLESLLNCCETKYFVHVAYRTHKTMHVYSP